MRVTRMFIAVLAVALCFPLNSFSGAGDGERSAVFQQDKELVVLKPHRPVKIRLKRNSKGHYSWDLSGSDVEEVLKIDRRLQEFLEKTE